MKLPYDKNPGRQFMPQNVAGTRCLWVCVCEEVYACVCVHARLMKCVRNSVRIVDRSGVHSTSSHETGTHTHTNRRSGSLLEIWYFPIFIAFGAACACLFAFYDGNANNNWRKFLPSFFSSFSSFFIFLSMRKLLKCHTDISYSMHTYLFECVCVSRIYLSFHTRSEANEKYANEIVTQFLKRGGALLFHLHADEYNLKI